MSENPVREKSVSLRPIERTQDMRVARSEFTQDFSAGSAPQPVPNRQID